MNVMRRAFFALAFALSLVACEEGMPRTVPHTLGTAPGTSAPSQPAPQSTDVNPSPEPPASTVPTRKGVVTRVVDGDTAHISIDGTVEKVRFIGINTPESTTRHEPYGAEASAYTKRSLSNKTVYVETDAELRDRYGRLLAYIWLSKPVHGDEAEVRLSLFNARLLLDGYAQVSTFPPNVKYVDYFLPLQEEAREAGRGLWGLGEKSQAAPAPTKGNCDPSYPTVCIVPPPPDLDCGDIPYRRFKVVGADPHRFDGDRDGIGCES